MNVTNTIEKDIAQYQDRIQDLENQADALRSMLKLMKNLQVSRRAKALGSDKSIRLGFELYYDLSNIEFFICVLASNKPNVTKMQMYTDKMKPDIDIAVSGDNPLDTFNNVIKLLIYKGRLGVNLNSQGQETYYLNTPDAYVDVRSDCT